MPEKVDDNEVRDATQQSQTPSLNMLSFYRLTLIDESI